MDEQGESILKPALYYAEKFGDHDWLQLLNIDRKREGVDFVSPEIFEVIMDQLEKEWFTLVQYAYLNLWRAFADKVLSIDEASP